MVYESDFTTRRSYSTRPVVSSYSVSTPRYDLLTERPGAHRSHNSSDYSYQYKSETSRSSSNDPHSYRPAERSSYSSTVERSARSGPGGYNYSTERTSTAGAGPGGYSYSSTTSGRLPGGTTYRHYSYRYPVSRTVTGSSRVYSTSYPIYSYSPRVTTKRVITSPVRTVYSTPIVRTRVITSPIRTTTTRVYSSPVRTTVYSSPSIHSEYIAPYTSSYSSSSYSSSVLPYSSYSYSPSIRTRVVETPVRVIRSSRLIRSSLSPERIITSPIRTLPSVLNKELDRIAHRTRPGYGYHALTNYLNSEPFINFESETKRIRNSTNNLMRELHTPVTRRSRSVTPFPAYTYEPASKQALDAYVARVTNPTRHLAKEVHNITQYPDTPRKSKYVGKSHLASVRILGDKAYNTRSALYNPDKVRTDINLLSRYIQNKRGRSEASDRVVVSNEVEGAVEA